MFRRKKVLNKIGYFDSVRAGGDSEFIERLKTVFGNKALTTLTLPLYYALYHNESLTNNSEIMTGELTMSLPRRFYKHKWLQWHKDSGTNCFMPFPLDSRPFEIPDRLRVEQ